jgi:hypothetical protein
MIGDARFAGQRDGNDVDRLIVVEGTKDKRVERVVSFGSFGTFGSSAGGNGSFGGSVFTRSGGGCGQCASFE